MKTILTIVSVIISIGVLAQDKDKVTELTYCGQTFRTPEKCTANSQYELTCDNFTIQWLYMNEQMLTVMPQQFIGQLETTLKKAKKEKIQCSSIGTKLDGYKMTYKDGKEEKYRIVTFGTVNGQPVLINLGLDNNPVDNNSLPEFVKQIIQLLK